MLQFKNCNAFVFIPDVIKRFACFYSNTALKNFTILLLILIAYKSNAQKDTTVVDTVSMSNIDSLTKPNDDEYVDTTVKHIYDTSEYFFNWKDSNQTLYTTNKITQQHLIDSDVKKLKNENDFWYVFAIEKIEARLRTDAAFRDSLLKAGNNEITDENKKDFTQQTWFHFIVWFIIISVFLGAIIYFLLQNKINFFSKEAASSSQSSETNAHEDIFNLSYNERIKKAETEQNYRVAVRLIFLQTLKLLSDTNHIKYQPDYTNLNYLQQLHQSNLYNDFSKVTRSYEYVWYGKFKISSENYAAIKKDFLMLQNKIA
jgi:uncharacterized protein DUF4129